MFTKASLILMVTLIIFVMLVHIEASVAGRFFENFEDNDFTNTPPVAPPGTSGWTTTSPPATWDASSNALVGVGTGGTAEVIDITTPDADGLTTNSIFRLTLLVQHGNLDTLVDIKVVDATQTKSLGFAIDLTGGGSGMYHLLINGNDVGGSPVAIEAGVDHVGEGQDMELTRLGDRLALFRGFKKLLEATIIPAADQNVIYDKIVIEVNGTAAQMVDATFDGIDIETESSLQPSNHTDNLFLAAPQPDIPFKAHVVDASPGIVQLFWRYKDDPPGFTPEMTSDIDGDGLHEKIVAVDSGRRIEY